MTGFGASVDAAGTMFRLWAPAARRVELVLDGAPPAAAAPQGDGWYGLRRDGVGAGTRYRWRIDGELLVPDPASRWNPDGPHGPSVVVDPGAHAWADDGWRGRPWLDAVILELHVGTFTAAGTYAAAAAQLDGIAALGFTAVQLMPLADFPGRHGWGYDGVLPFAPFHGYGTPAELKAFVQAAHAQRLMVFGDVVYNHFGPDGNWLHAYAPQFFTGRHRTPWGDAIDYGVAAVREFAIANALYWLDEFRFDGLRLDAVHAIHDASEPHVLDALAARVRAAFPDRHVHLLLEHDGNDASLLAPGPYDAQWSGEVHHPLHVLLTGETDGYYAEYADAPVQRLGRALAHGYSRVGGPHNADGAPPRRDAEARDDAPLTAIVNFLQTHDQVGNRAFGDRLAAGVDPAALRLAAAIVCLAPSIPLLFMGEERGATTPFPYFADWRGELRDAVRRGRLREFAQFPRYAEAAAAGTLPDPCSEATFAASKLGADDAPAAVAWRAFYADLFAARARWLRPLLPRLAARGHAHAAHGRRLDVAWRFEGGAALTLQANLSDAAAAASAAPGRIVHVHGEPFGPWSARWLLQDGAP